MPALIVDAARAEHRVREPLHHPLDQDHEIRAVGIGLVQLEHRELGVVLRGQPLVPEIAVDLVHALEAADDEPLEVQLRRDAQVHVLPERVVVRDEGPRDRAARDRLHHRGLDLEEAEGVEEVAQEPHHARAHAERLARGVVDDQVDVALPIARLGVREAVPLVGQRTQRLHQQAHRFRAHRELAGARAHEHALGADDVAHVPALERLVGGTEGIRLQV